MNRLAQEKSPYLLQHQHNPVDWFPWGDDAFALAREQDKPIFLSVGYSACHWCHVMERESFEDAATAELLNAHFVSIKVDREERPDVDEIYMTAVQMLTQHGGWPMSVFLTPDGRPFYGGTYFPPENRHGRIGFKALLRELASTWTHRRDEVEEVASHLAQDLRTATRQRPVDAAETGPIDARALLRRAIEEQAARFDAEHGGFGGAPKFPPHHTLALLLQADPDATEARAMLTRTLDAMARGGIYDHVGGGFHRYSTDAVWLLPHFEKMLYDNALLARVYAEAAEKTGSAAYARIARETCDWVLRDLTDPGDGFHAALDADSEGEEGKYYVWTRAEVEDAAFAERYRIRPDGNFHDEATGRPTGTNIPHLAPDAELPATLPSEIATARAALLARRTERVPPGKDDKVIAAWNGLMIGALAYAGKTLNEPRYRAAAQRAANFALTTLRPDGTHLVRRFARGEAGLPAFLDDYAFLADGLLDLADATGDDRWRADARSLADVLLAEFWDDEDGGFFHTATTGRDGLIASSKDLFDGALPAPNGVATRALARLGGKYADTARQILTTFRGVLERVPHGTQTLIHAALIAFDGADAPPETIALSVPPDAVRIAPGGSTEATFTLRLADGFHLNTAPSAALATDAPAAVGPVRKRGDDAFIVPIAVAEDAAPGRYHVTLTVGCQVCTENECLPAEAVTATLSVIVVSDGA